MGLHRSLLLSVHEELFRPRFAAVLAIAFAVSAAFAFGLKELMPVRTGAPPLAGIAATMLLVLAVQALGFVNLGGASHSEQSWAGTTAWVKTVFLAGAALIGILVSGIVAESPHMAWIIWIYCAGLTGLICAIWGLFSILTGRRILALQIVLVLTVLVNSALFWTRGPLTALGSHEDQWAKQMPEAVMKLSPPLALACLWHQEGDRSTGREVARLDIIRSPMTYDVWIGSYQAVPYPEILPRFGRGDEGFQPGLLLALCLWALPLFAFTEILRAKKARFPNE